MMASLKADKRGVAFMIRTKMALLISFMVKIFYGDDLVFVDVELPGVDLSLLALTVENVVEQPTRNLGKGVVQGRSEITCLKDHNSLRLLSGFCVNNHSLVIAID